MTKHPKFQFIVADGGRARWVRRSDAADDFVTFKETKAEPRAKGHPQGVVFEGSSGRGFSVAEREGAVREHREAFAREIADAISLEAAQGAFEHLIIIAPARTLAAIKRRLSVAAAAMLGKTLAKDLSKTPDHELGTWLRPLELA